MNELIKVMRETVQNGRSYEDVSALVFELRAEIAFCRAMLTDAANALDKTVWRPIAEAPRDGVKHGPFILGCRWMPEQPPHKQRWQTSVTRWCVDGDVLEGGYWTFGVRNVWHPTYFAPIPSLPAPPEGAER